MNESKIILFETNILKSLTMSFIILISTLFSAYSTQSSDLVYISNYNFFYGYIERVLQVQI
jgi:hypothetical protein